MKPVYLYTVISLMVAIIIALLFIRLPFFDVETNSDLGGGMLRRYYDYRNDPNENKERQQSFPYILNAVLYLAVQFFILRSIKKVYGTFMRGRVIIYLMFFVITIPFIVLPYVFLERVQRLFVTGLNPFLSQLIYIPIYYQIWIWVDVIIRILLKKTNVEVETK